MWSINTTTSCGEPSTQNVQFENKKDIVCVRERNTFNICVCGCVGVGVFKQEKKKQCL